MKAADTKAKLMLILSMSIFGTIGIFRRYIPLDSATLAMLRGFIGAAMLILIMTLTKQKLSFEKIKKNLIKLCVSGAMIGLNWILLFEAYNFTTVAVATLCYYMSPIIVIMVSPLLLREKLTKKKIGCVIMALAGMVLISGVLKGGGIQNYKGVLFGLGAAMFYAGLVIMNKKITDIDPYSKTVIQLAAAAVVILPYVLKVRGYAGVEITPFVIGMILFVGIVHTGFGYTLYFASLDKLPGQTVAIFGYIDPVIAVLLSAFLLKEPMGIAEAIGMILILAATFISDRE